MAKSKVPVTYAFGRRDRVDPKLAPLGVLKVGKNLRVRKDGRLGTRTGYQPLDMSTANGDLFAYDLHEYRGRLCALGSDAGDGFPTDRFEYLGIEPYPWRGTDRFGQRVTVNPFTDLREVAGIAQPGGGVSSSDVAASEGYVCLAYVTAAAGVNYTYVVIVDAATDQVVHAENLYFDGTAGPLFNDQPSRLRVIAVGLTFYVAAVFADGAISIAQYTVGTSTRFTAYIAVASVGDPITAFDMCAVTHPTTGNVVLAWDRGTLGNLTVLVINAAGAVVGSPIIVGSGATNNVFVALEADQVANRINVFTVETPTNGRLRTYNFAGTLLVGPTTTASGATGSICRLPLLVSHPESVAVAVNATSFDVSVRVYNQATHAAVTAVFSVKSALMRTRLLSGQSTGQAVAVVFGGLVAPVISSPEQATNALFYLTPTTAHVAFRDYVRAADQAAPTVPFNLSRDTTTGELAWLALVDPGVDDIAMPVVSLVKFQSAARRQGVEFGDLYYEAGAAPAVYDGRFAAEVGFGEAPGLTLQASNSATYESTASLTGKTVNAGIVRTSSKTLEISVDNAGTETTVSVWMAFSAPLSVVAAFIQATGSAVLTASAVDNKLQISAIATGADVSITVTGGTMAELVGLGNLVGVPFYGSTALSPGGTYYYTLHFEVVLADKSVMFGPPSVGGAAGADFATATSVTLTGDQNVVTLTGTIPHSLRIALGDALYGADVTAVFSRTQWQAFSKTPGSIFRRCVTTRLPTGPGRYGSGFSVEDHVSDAALSDNEALYTQADRGALSGPLEQDAPRACRYITATESRLITGGLGRTSLVQVSREAFTGETISFSDFSQFFSQVAGPVIGVHALDSARFVFTLDRIYAITGVGPDDLGGAGFDAPVEIPTPSGLSNAWSFLEGPDGLWFQLDDTKLFRIPRGGGAPTWEGVDVEDTLLAFPHITGACKHKGDNVAVFACCSDDGNARFLVRDFRTENWVEDVPFIHIGFVSSGFAVAAITAYGESLAYVVGGVVYVQTTGFVDGPDAFIETQVRTHPLYPFGVGGYGQIYELLLTGEYRGDCQLDCRVSYDDGQSFATLDSFDLSGLSVGATIQRKWTLPQDITSSIVIEFSCSPSEAEGADATSEGFVFNQVDLLVEAEDGLRELEPSEMA